MIPTAKFIADLHRQVIAHAGRTIKTCKTVFYRFFFIEQVKHFSETLILLEFSFLYTLIYLDFFGELDFGILQFGLFYNVNSNNNSMPEFPLIDPVFSS